MWGTGTLVSVNDGEACTVQQQWSKLQLRPNVRNTFDGRPLRGCWEPCIDKKKERKTVQQRLLRLSDIPVFTVRFMYLQIPWLLPLISNSITCICHLIYCSYQIPSLSYSTPISKLYVTFKFQYVQIHTTLFISLLTLSPSEILSLLLVGEPRDRAPRSSATRFKYSDYSEQPSCSLNCSVFKSPSLDDRQVPSDISLACVHADQIQDIMPPIHTHTPG